MSSTRLVLVSPGYGAGWSAWEHGKVARLMAEYPPIVAALLAGDTLTEEHPAVLQLLADVEAMGEYPPCLLGLGQLGVVEVDGRYRIEEYDGFETLMLECDEVWY